ncbi:hypothetical protein CN424_00405 [Bacillus cereus]|nr:hypothetical protein CN424_00405 [Bacillus cereus]
MYVIKEVVSLMFKLLRYPIFLGLLGSFFTSSGIVLQHILPYSPSIGWNFFKQENKHVTHR